MISKLQNLIDLDHNLYRDFSDPMPAVLGLCLICAFTKIAFAWLSNKILSFDFFITEIKKQCTSNFRNRIDVS